MPFSAIVFEMGLNRKFPTLKTKYYVQYNIKETNGSETKGYIT